MHVLRSTKGFVLGVIVTAVAAFGVGIAVAASNTVTDTDNVHLRIVESQFDDGFVGAWHKHAGPVIVQVKQGYFKLYQGSCNPTIVGPGETFVEVPNVPIRGEAKGEIEWTATFIYETGQAASTPVSDPCS